MRIYLQLLSCKLEEADMLPVQPPLHWGDTLILRFQITVQRFTFHGAWALHPRPAQPRSTAALCPLLRPPRVPFGLQWTPQVVFQLLFKTIMIKIFLKKQAFPPATHLCLLIEGCEKVQELATLKISSASRLTQHRNSQAFTIYIQLCQSGE